MKIAILQNNGEDGPAYLGTWLRQQNVAFDVVAFDAGDSAPGSLAGYDGLAVLGGAMSVNDDLPFLRDSEALIREARDTGKPVIGHCLGGQLIARAFGATVSASQHVEIGWSQVKLANSPKAKAWFGEYAGTTRDAAQWHYESFALPAGAELIASNDACVHQAFAIHNMLAMQFHIEIDATKFARWIQSGKAEIASHAGVATVQPARAIAADIPMRMPASNALAKRIYERFVALAGQSV